MTKITQIVLLSALGILAVAIVGNAADLCLPIRALIAGIFAGVGMWWIGIFVILQQGEALPEPAQVYGTWATLWAILIRGRVIAEPVHAIGSGRGFVIVAL
jgi:hypothetical protein